DIALLFKQATLERDMRVVLFDSTLGIERWSTILDLDGEGILWPLPEAIGIATTSTGDNEDTDITLVELSESGEYLSASVLPLPAFETPKALFLSNGQLGFAGDIVCCDSPESFEPSGVFWGITNFFVVNTEAPAKSPITVEVGPNPFRNRLLIDWEAHQVQMQEIRIFNALGQLIWRQPTPQAPLQIGTMDWPAGSYYLFAQAAEGQSVEKLLLFNE
ncbi:MAG: T9SS type A sorting domain-containing protein, partial [Bacteroidota bacterium]